MEVSLTELRQRLFELADRVLETGEEVVIVRRGRRLRFIREEAPKPAFSRLSKLRPQAYEIGPELDPHESPARWSETHGVNETPATYATVAPKRERARTRKTRAKAPSR